MPTSPIQHVVVLMFENHSFDQMLGWLSRDLYPDSEGINPQKPGSNPDKDGKPFAQLPTTATSVTPDPVHETVNVLAQLADGNQGFVLDYSKAFPGTTGDQRQQIMGYFDKGVLPALDELAQSSAVCDHWFSSVPGPTWTNRFFVHSGTSKGRVLMPGGLWNDVRDPGLFLHYDQDTIYDRLNEQGISWKVYHGDIPQSLVLTHQQSITPKVGHDLSSRGSSIMDAGSSSP